MTTRPSPPHGPAPPVLSTPLETPPKVKVEVKEEIVEDPRQQQPGRGIIRPREEEEEDTPHARSTRRRLMVRREFKDVLPGYLPYIAEYAAERIGCALVARPLTPDRPSVSSSETQTTPTPPVTSAATSTLPTPPVTPPECNSPPRIVGRTVAVMSTMTRPRPIRSSNSAYTVLRGTVPPARPPPPAVRRPPSPALGAPPREQSHSSSNEEEEGEFPDLPERYSPAVCDVTIMRLV